MAKIGHQDLDGGTGRGGANLLDATDELVGAAVGQIVAIDRVITTCLRPSIRTMSARLSGSCGLTAPGLPVATLQKAQARVQMSPRIITVACLRAQHSPILGQAASSQTVCSLRSRMTRCVSPYPGEVGAFTLIQAGLRGDGLSGRCCFSG